MLLADLEIVFLYSTNTFLLTGSNINVSPPEFESDIGCVKEAKV